MLDAPNPLADRLLLAVQREREMTNQARDAGRRARFLVEASRDLAMSLDESATRDAVRRRVLMRDGSWCIVDIVELNGTVQRLAVAHPDAAKQALAQTFADRWFPSQPAASGETNSMTEQPAPDGLGLGGLLVVPLVVRGTVLGAITFVTRKGDAPLSSDEVTLASDLANICALALDNARLYRESEVLRAVADEANRVKSTFLSNMSHELMTPLTAIGGYVTLLDMGLRGPVTPDQRADLARIADNQRHLATLISDILVSAHSEGGRLAYRLTTIPALRALDEVADMLQGAAAEQQMALVRLPGDEHAMMWADADRVRQILLNLVMNAIKYASVAGGAITLSAVTTPRGVSLRVADYGPGIPEANWDTIFEPFAQLTSGLTERRGGVGLGLAISRDLARAMNGDLTVDSTLGAGTTFTLTLPTL